MIFMKLTIGNKPVSSIVQLLSIFPSRSKNLIDEKGEN